MNNLVFFPGSQLYRRVSSDNSIRKIVEESKKLNYWDRAKHIKLKKKNAYLVLILNLMRGSVTKKRFGLMPNFLINFFLKPERVKKNLQNPFSTYTVLNFVSIIDLIRERILKQIYRSLPISFKIWYDQVRYHI